MASLSPFVSFCLFWPGFGLSSLVMAFLTLCITLLYLRKRCHLCSVVELSTWFTREFAETVRFHRAGRSTLSDQLTISGMFISQTTYREDSIYKRRNCNLKLKSSFTKVKPRIPEKIAQLVLAIQYRHKKRCSNYQDHEQMKSLLKQKLKDRLQSTGQSARNKESRALCFEAIGKLCRHRRIIYYSPKQNGKNGFLIYSRRINFHSFSFQIAVYLTLFVIDF